jgi:hypothetical protein
VDAKPPGKVLVVVDPPFRGHLYERRDDVSQLVLAPRFEGSAIVPRISEWPLRVYMLVPKKGGTWNAGPFDILDWGILER